VSAGAGRLYYEGNGSGHPILLIHARFLDRRMLDEQFELFADRFRFVRFDVRGSGKSSRPTDKHSEIRDHQTLRTGLNADETHVVGATV